MTDNLPKFSPAPLVSLAETDPTPPPPLLTSNNTPLYPRIPGHRVSGVTPRTASDSAAPAGPSRAEPRTHAPINAQ